MHLPLLTYVSAAATLGAVRYVWASGRGTEQAVAAAIPAGAADRWHFVAMEYCHGILNRTYLVCVTDRMICGAKVRGPLAQPMLVTERWQDPNFYPKPRAVKRVADVNVEGPEFLRLAGANFQIARSQVTGIEYTQAPKWGMGTVPYSGRLILQLRDGGRRELILLGRQDGPALKARLASSPQAGLAAAPPVCAAA